LESILDPAFTTVLVSQGLAELKKGDKVEAVFSGTVPGVGLIVRKPAGEPVVPSIIFSAYKSTEQTCVRYSSGLPHTPMAGPRCVAVVSGLRRDPGQETGRAHIVQVPHDGHMHLVVRTSGRFPQLALIAQNATFAALGSKRTKLFAAQGCYFFYSRIDVCGLKSWRNPQVAHVPRAPAVAAAGAFICSTAQRPSRGAGVRFLGNPCPRLGLGDEAEPFLLRSIPGSDHDIPAAVIFHRQDFES
jgi:hypothetical protein